ncbi:MAG TPA: class I SAM-dependent methyltransferase [Acetobacteraceae bacterium]|nr:class I SAM-dependent methyltransferase [Acetobacteraceae bacterium]
MDRRGRLLGDIPLGQSTGLEIGALHAPLVRRTESHVRYVDYAPAETLRANFRYTDADPADIQEVDIVWGERPLHEAAGGTVDYVVASHVVEHVPDLIGWLLEVHAVLKTDGVFGLAVPDRRYTFDVRRHVSTPGEMVEAYLRRYRQPSLRQVFDAAALSKNSEEVESWRPGKSSGGLPAEVMKRLPLAFDLVKGIAAEPRYNDAHCWIFTPASFLDTAEALSALHRFPFEIDQLFPTEPGTGEFQVRLKAVADGAGSAIAQSIHHARQELAAYEQRAAASGPMFQTIEPAAQEHALQASLSALEREKLALGRENAALRASLAAMRQSTSWRITMPLRAFKQLILRHG